MAPTDLPSTIPPELRAHAAGLAAMVALAGLDIAGALLAKEWAVRHDGQWFAAGLVTFGLLFAVYARSLQVAELSVVTLGWVVFLQVGLLAVDRLRYGVEFPAAKWAAVVAILVLQAYLILAPNPAAADAR